MIMDLAERKGVDLILPHRKTHPHGREVPVRFDGPYGDLHHEEALPNRLYLVDEDGHKRFFLLRIEFGLPTLPARIRLLRNLCIGPVESLSTHPS
jgi:hypothetical protein